MMSFPSLRHPRRIKSRNTEVDVTADPRQTLSDIIDAVCKSKETTDRTKLSYLNLFAKLAVLSKGKFSEYGFSSEALLVCFRGTLLHHSVEIRSGGLRTIRHILLTPEDVDLFNKLKIPYLIARSLDIFLKNDTERMEALKVMRRVLVLAPHCFDAAMARSLVALAIGGFEENNRMLRSCLAVLSELAVLNEDLFIEVGGVSAITRNILECQTLQISESLCGVLLYLLDHPRTRNRAAVDLHCVAAPYCDFHYKHGWKDKERRDERELRFHSSRRALLTMLRSWPGVLHFCNPKDDIGLKAIIQALYLDQLEVRKGILDFLYDLFNLQQPEWTDELSVALSAIDPSDDRLSWRLIEGFVVAEGYSILPNLAKSVPNLVETHTAFLLYCFLENGLLRALTEVIATGDTFISVRATVFLGEILRLMQYLLPSECYPFNPELPSLLEYATTNKPQALGAITALQQFHKLLRKRPASCSLYLDFIIKNGTYLSFPYRDRSERVLKYGRDEKKRNKLSHLVGKEDNFIKATEVLVNNDATTWNWNLIRMLLQNNNLFKLNLLETDHKLFIEHLLAFYMPSNNRYSHMDLNSHVSWAYTLAGLDLITCLINSEENEAHQCLIKLFTDILFHIKVLSSKSVHDCLFSPQHMIATQCRTYFLFIGQLGINQLGNNLLTSISMYKELEHLACTVNNDCYLKLIVCSMNYSQPGATRLLLSRILVNSNEVSRLYATQFLLILLRVGVPDFPVWGVQLLVKQLEDESKYVRITALDILLEACEITECLETLIKSKVNLQNMGDKGILLFSKFLSLPSGYDTLNKDDFIFNEIKTWDNQFSYRYVKILENNISNGLTIHHYSHDETNDVGGIMAYMSYISNVNKEVFVYPHLYGQLSQHPEGYKSLMKHGRLTEMIACVKDNTCTEDSELLELKMSLWALGHFSLSQQGFEYLQEHGVFNDIVSISETSQIYSVRATAYFVISLIATKPAAVVTLRDLGWIVSKHDRHNLYPCISTVEKDVTNFRYDFGHFLGKNEELLFYNTASSSVPVSSTDKSHTSHQRSLSETATFDFPQEIDKYSEFSTNSDQKYDTFDEDSEPQIRSAKSRDQSCISNSSSVMFEKTSEKTVRRHSESCKNAPFPSSQSPENFLSSLDRGDFLRSCHGEKSRTLQFFRSPSLLPSQRQSFISKLSKNLRMSNDYLSKISLASLSSVKRYNIKGSSGGKDNGYLGICLPLNISKLFPSDSDNTKNVKDHGAMNESTEETYPPLTKQTKFLIHEKADCLTCSISGDQKLVTNSNACIEVLKQVESFLNPGWNKQVKLALLDRKHKSPELFQNVCLYSEISKLLSQNSYRLASRRILHELFFDISLDKPPDVEKLFTKSKFNDFKENPNSPFAQSGKICSNKEQTNVLTSPVMSH